MVDTTQTTTEKKLTQSDIRGVFLRSNLFQGSWNFERMQALGFCFSMVPAIRRLYPENNEARKQAIRRHLEFFNTQPFVAAPILGVTLALEEQRANGAEIDDGAINGIKVGLMGPLAGVGDPIFWGTVRPVFAALGAGIAMSGSLLGPLLFFILFNLVRLATRYYGVAYGYSKGIDIVKDMGGGFLQKLTEGASILGLFVMGALVNKWTHVNIPLVVSRITDQTGKEHVTTVQTILDQLMPGLVPLLLQRVAAELGIVLVMPDTSPRGEKVANDDGYDLGQGAGFYLNATQPPWATHYRMYDYLRDELPALVQSQFNVSDRCAISGHSMGGHGALIMALKNPGKYTSVSAFAPIVNPCSVPWGIKAFSSYLGEDKNAWLEWDSCALMYASNAQDAIPTLIDQGDNDQFLADQLQPAVLAEAARQKAWPMTLRIQPGYDHSYYFIASFIEDHLRFHAQYLLK